MKAVVIHRYGGPEVLTLEERAIPQITDDEVLIKVAAFGINRPDIMQRVNIRLLQGLLQIFWV